MSSEKKVLHQKRSRTGENIEGKPKKNKKNSPEERRIIFVVNSKEFLLKISSASHLFYTLNRLKFDIPYYKKNGKEIILNDDDNINIFFHSSENPKIYNYSSYSFFDENTFESQYKASQINLSSNLKELYFDNDYFCKLHLDNYLYLRFKNIEFNFKNFRDPVYDHNKIDIIEIFSKNGLGISTYFFTFFQKYRYRNKEANRFIPFLIFYYKELKNAKTIDESFFLLNFAIVNAFLSYEEYSLYSTKLFNLIKNNGLEKIESIIFEIMKDINEIWIKNKYYYKPRVIIDRYYFYLDKDELFKNRLYKESLNLQYKLIIIYSFREKKSNKVLYDYLTHKKPSNFMYSYTDILYTNIDKLQTKYNEIYSTIYPKLTNYIKIQNCNTIEEANEIKYDEKNEIKEYLDNFYPSKELKEFYINQLINLIGIAINLESIEDLFLNIPFEIFDFYEIEGIEGKIVLELKSSSAKNELDHISNNSIIQLINSPLFNELQNFIKGGLVEKAIIQIIKNNESPFGAFDKVFKIDCFLNKLGNKAYDFTNEQRKDKITKLKYFSKLKEDYKTFSYTNEHILFIPFLPNAKEWDAAFILKNEDDQIELCLIQISINKPIKKIQEMIRNFDNKKRFIKKKIKMIYNIKISFVNILFILSKQYQDNDTIKFMNEFQLPYIYFNNENNEQNFLYNNSSKILKFELSIENHYATNKEKFIKCLDYKIINKKKIDNNFIEDDDILDEYEDNIQNNESALKISDIIYNEI